MSDERKPWEIPISYNPPHELPSDPEKVKAFQEHGTLPPDVPTSRRDREFGVDEDEYAGDEDQKHAQAHDEADSFSGHPNHMDRDDVRQDDEEEQDPDDYPRGAVPDYIPPRGV